METPTRPDTQPVEPQRPSLADVAVLAQTDPAGFQNFLSQLPGSKGRGTGGVGAQHPLSEAQ